MKKKTPTSKSIKLFNNGHLFIDLYEFDGRPGTYMIFAAKNGINIPIKRIHGTDKHGILYIGATKDLFRRLYECLFDSIIHNRGSHPFGKKYNRISKARRQYPLDSLYVFVIPNDDPFILEAKEKKNYDQMFGEYPAYNLN